MKTEMQKMRDGERYRFDDKEMQASFARAKRLCAKLNNMSSVDEGYRELIEELIPDLPATADICPPFNCDHGHGIRMGEHSFMNYGCVVLDAATVTLGRHVKLGPCCKLFTPQHPLDYIESGEPHNHWRRHVVGWQCNGVSWRNHRPTMYNCSRVSGYSRYTRRLFGSRKPCCGEKKAHEFAHLHNLICQ